MRIKAFARKNVKELEEDVNLFLKNNPDYYVSAYTTSVYKDEHDLDVIEYSIILLEDTNNEV